MKYSKLLILILFLLVMRPCFSQITYPGSPPGKAKAFHSSREISLENNAVKMVFQIKGNQIHSVSFTDKANRHTLNLLPLSWFELTMRNGLIISDKEFHIVEKPLVKSIPLQKKSARYADHLSGKMIEATFVNPSSGLTIDWQARLSDGANYIKQRWAFHTKDSLPIIKYSMLEVPADSIVQEGTVDGSPLVSKQMFFALEHPMSKNQITQEKAVSYLPSQNALRHSDSLVITTVSGATPANQLRRGFLNYIERERAHPYRPYLHYNSWYDLSWIDRKMEETSCLDRIGMYGDSLVKKRHVPMKAFLFDDGWDNDSTLWEVSSKFPGGFTKMDHLAASYRAHLGLWLSPWGGYGESQEQRLKYGRIQHPPFETNENGFSLAGPVYFNRFKEVTTNFMLKDGVSMFKFDGVGAGNGASGAGLSYQKDIEALLVLTKDLRKVNPDLYLSLTVGTWPSPYWLYYGDAVWRAGSDFGLAGKGDKRQQWITYRDAESYKNVVKRAPLFPLNSVMLHGINISKVGYPKQLEMDFKGISDGIWSFFASGTSLQELYINPHLLTPEMWDCLADAAKWSQENAHILQDVHWIGGDPAKEEIYGYAAWSPVKGVFTLRNPSPNSQSINIDVQKIFELPENSSSYFKLSSAINKNDASSEMKVQKEKSFNVVLAPFEVKVFDALPMKD
ncbi:MAG: hypothetical protein ABI374_05865 [Ginsengibacter sp.]